MKKNLILFIILVALHIITSFEIIANTYSNIFTKLFVNTIGRFFSLFPFSVFEWGVISLIIGLVFILVKYRSIANMITYVLCMCLVFTLTTGIQYKQSNIEIKMNFEKRDYTLQGLEKLMDYTVDKLIEIEEPTLSKKDLHHESKVAMSHILPGYYPNPKPMFFSKWMTLSGLTGIFSPFTIEANYNKDIPMFNKPFTICHELSHLQGYMSEDEANFLAYMACVESDNRYFNYSGYLLSFIYILNELSVQGVDVEKYIKKLPTYMIEDLNEDSHFWNENDSMLKDITNTVNDTYLKANSVDEGVLSYQRFIVLIYSYYYETIFQ